MRCAEVAGHDDDRIAEIYRTSLGIGQPSIIQDLQEKIEEIRRCLFYFIEQHDTIRFFPYCVSKLCSFFIPHISRRSTDQAGYAVLFHILTHIDAYHRFFTAKKLLCQCPGQLGFANPAGAEKQERANRAVYVLESCPCPAYGFRHSRHGFILTDDPLVQFFFQVEQAVRFRFCQLPHRDSRPLGHDVGDIIASHDQTGIVMLLPFFLHRFQLP